MSRRPNPWIALPSLVGGVIAAWLGGTVTAVSCRYRQTDGTVITCPTATTVVSIMSFLLVTVGMAVVMVLVYRSLAEWRREQDRSS